MDKIKLSESAHLALPQLVKREYPLFIAFLKAYYEDLDSKNLTRKLDFAKSIDSSINDFVDKVKNEVSSLAPKLAENKLFLSHAKEFYASRGSVESYNLLFRLLYNKPVNIIEPGKKILKASDGRWTQNNSIYVNQISGDIFDYVGKYLNIKSEILGIKHKIKILVVSVQRTKFENVYEVFFEKKYGSIKIGDVIEEDELFCVVEPTISSVKILKPGFGFKVGQMFQIEDGIASGSIVKVTKVSDIGEILRLQFAAYNPGYKTKFIYNIVESAALKPSVFYNGGQLKAQDVIDQYRDSGVISKNDYVSSEYVGGDYVGNVLASFSDSGISEETLYDVATLEFDIGSTNKYPGYYSSSIGLISDDSYIFDGEYYNDFSYIVQIDEKLDSFKKVVLELLNPIGHRLFADYLIQNDIELFFEIVEPVIRILLPQYSESDESFRLYDKLISGRKDLYWTGDDATNTYKWPGDENKLLIHVKINDRVLDPSEYTNTGTSIILNYNPEPWETVNIRYVSLSYSGLSSLQNVFFDFVFGDWFDKPILTTDFSYRHFYKNLVGPYGDSYDFSDAKSYWMQKVLNSDPALFFTDTNKLDTAKLLDDIDSLLNDSTFYSFFKNVADFITASDDKQLTVFKNILEDPLGSFLDSNFLGTDKNLSDSQTMFDVLTRQANGYLNFSDSQTMFDVLTRQFIGYLNFSEIVDSIIEVVNILTNKSFSDIVNSIIEVVNILTNKSFSESGLSFSDDDTYSYSAYRTENIPLSTEGHLYCNMYNVFDGGYFSGLTNINTYNNITTTRSTDTNSAFETHKFN